MDYEPATFLNQSGFLNHSRPFAAAGNVDLLILNQPIADFEVFQRLWNHTNLRVCADGGANRLYDMFNGPLGDLRPGFLPSSIHGDLDSLRDDVRQYYLSLGVDVSQDRDQNSTDFGKAMSKIISLSATSKRREILILGTLGGRVDQGLGLLHELIREETRNPEMRLWLFSETSISFILRPGRNVVRGVQSSMYFSPVVGILPIYGLATITTKGLEWDVTEWGTQMGHQVSTSNNIISDEIWVETDQAVLFTIERLSELPKHPQRSTGENI